MCRKGETVRPCRLTRLTGSLSSKYLKLDLTHPHVFCCVFIFSQKKKQQTNHHNNTTYLIYQQAEINQNNASVEVVEVKPAHIGRSVPFSGGSGNNPD